MITYFNIKTIYGVETIDHLNKSEFDTWKEYKKELNRLKNEYILSGLNVYLSQRSQKNYFNN